MQQNANSVAFNEDIFFDHPHTVKAVLITMRKCLHDYFGISEVTPIESGEPQLMIVSGITSKNNEMCLQVIASPGLFIARALLVME